MGDNVKVFKPENIKELVEILEKTQACIYSGGTDLMVKNRQGAGRIPNFKKDVVFLEKLKILKEIKVECGILHIGSCCTLSELNGSKFIPEPLKSSIAKMASPAIRNIATIGGNICNASPAGDLLPFLYCYDALICLQSAKDERKVHISDFLIGPGKTSMKEGEFLKKIEIKDLSFNDHFYWKVATRKANALSKLSIAVLIKRNDEKLLDLKVALGALAPTVIRVREIEEKILKDNLKDVTDILENFKIHIKPIDDQRSSADYRLKTAIKVLENIFDKLKI